MKNKLRYKGSADPKINELPMRQVIFELLFGH